MKRLVAFLTCLVITWCAFTFHLPITASSAGLEVETDMPTMVYSEIDVIRERQSMSDEELLLNGFTEEDIANIRSFNIELALIERASLDVEQLKGMGYSNEQIALLKNYDGSPLTADSPVLAAAATCTGYITNDRYDAVNNTLAFTYRFLWSNVPLYQYTDVFSLTWQAVNDNALAISSSANVVMAYVMYISTTTGEFINQTNLTTSIVPGFNGYRASYDVCIPYQGSADTLWIWAERGTMHVQVKPDGANTLNIIKAYGAVAHKKIVGSYSVGYTPGANMAFSFSYTPNWVFDTLGVAAYSLGRNGQCVPLQ